MLTHCSRANPELLLEITDGGLAVTLQIGENLTDRGVAGKGGLWEGGIRVPMIVRGPGVEPGAWSHVPAVGYDFFPTFCRLAGVSDELPKNLDGGDFSSVLFGKSQSIQRKEEGIVFHCPHCGAS